MKDIDYPVTLKAIDRVEKQNSDIAINVFAYETDVYPLKISKCTNRTLVNLLLILAGEKQHYCLMKNMSRLLSSQTSKRNGAQHFCFRCLNPFHFEESLSKHLEYCNEHEAVKTEMPEKRSILSFFFLNFNRSMRVPFIAYADFESFIKPIDTTCNPTPEKKPY